MTTYYSYSQSLATVLYETANSLTGERFVSAGVVRHHLVQHSIATDPDRLTNASVLAEQAWDALNMHVILNTRHPTGLGEYISFYPRPVEIASLLRHVAEIYTRNEKVPATSKNAAGNTTKVEDNRPAVTTSGDSHV